MQPRNRPWTVIKYLSVLLVASTVVGAAPHQQPSSFSVGPLARLSVSAAAQPEPQPQQDVRPLHAKIKHGLKHSYDVFSVTFSADGKQVAAGGILDRTVSIWDVGTGKLVRTLTDQQGGVNALAYSPDGHYLAAGRGFVRKIPGKVSINLWDAQTGTLLRNIPGPLPTVDDGSNDVKALAFSPDSKNLAVAFDANLIRIYDEKTGKLLKTISTTSGIASPLLYSPDGKYLAYGGWKQQEKYAIKVHDVNTGGLVRVLTGHPGIPEALTYSPDGKFIAAGGRENIISIYDVRSGDIVKTIQTGHSGYLKAVTYTPDGNYLASGSQDRTIKTWDSKTGELVETLTGHPGLIYSAAYSRDGKFIAAGGGSAVTIWEFNKEDG